MLLKQIEEERAKYGMLLNKNKCEAICTNPLARVHFQDGTLVNKKEEVKYLGCMLNKKGDMKTEIGKRLTSATITLRKLDLFWRHSSCPVKFKLIALDAVIRSKVLYGIETAHLKEPEYHKLEVF